MTAVLFDLIAVGTGAAASAGIEVSRHGVKVSSFLQSTSNPAVYAAGDAADTEVPKLTPVARYEGGTVASNLLKANHRKVEKLPIPSAVFTVPPLASVGMTEETARKEGRSFRVHMEDTGSWYSSRRVAEKCSGFKVLIEKETDQILGAHLFAPEADELINVFAPAMRMNVPAEMLRQMVLYTRPTRRM